VAGKSVSEKTLTPSILIIINSGSCAILQRVTGLLNRRDLLDFQGRLIFGTAKFGNANIFNVAFRPNSGHDLLILEVSTSHTTQHNR
jgi:hypothetical protein